MPTGLKEYLFLSTFPGYTREMMHAEPAWWVERMLETHALVKRGEAEQMRKQARSAKTRGR